MQTLWSVSPSIINNLHYFAQKVWIPDLDKDWDGSPAGTHLFTVSLKSLLNYVLPSSQC